MELPAKTQQLIEQSLKRLRCDPEHHLKAKDRFAIYKSFGPSRLEPFIYTTYGDAQNQQSQKTHFLNFTIADFTHCWLAILTVERVQTIWEEWNWELCEFGYTPQIRVKRILEENIGVLQRKVSFDDAYHLFCDDFNLGLNINNWVPYQVFCVYEAAYRVSELILGSNGINQLNMNEDLYKEATYNEDFANAALKAFTAINDNLPGEIVKWPERFDSQKRLEFWEWWLTEAIPQAWEIASSNSANQ